MVKNSSQVGLNSQMMLVLNHEKGLKFTLEWVFWKVRANFWSDVGKDLIPPVVRMGKLIQVLAAE